MSFVWDDHFCPECVGDRDVPDKLLDQLTHLRVLVDSLMGDRAKVSEEDLCKHKHTHC